MAKLLKPTIKCYFCHELYSPYYKGCREAYHCSCGLGHDTNTPRYYAGYGSDFDLDRFEFIEPYLLKPGDMICDACIYGFLEQGVIKNIGESAYKAYLNQ